MMTSGANLLGSGNDGDVTALVILGASGNLTHQKLGPALFSLFQKERLPNHVYIVGVARNEMTDEEFRNWLREGCRGPSGGAMGRLRLAPQLRHSRRHRSRLPVGSWRAYQPPAH